MSKRNHVPISPFRLFNYWMKKGKGIKKSVLKKEVKHRDYKDCLFEKREVLPV